MTRFERELSGALGAYWKESAEKELKKLVSAKKLQNAERSKVH